MTADVRAALLRVERMIEVARQRGQAGVVARQQLTEFVTRGERLAAELANKSAPMGYSRT